MRSPQEIGVFKTPCSELMFVLYMAVRLAGQRSITLPPSLRSYYPLVRMAVDHEGGAADGKYVYLTVKRLWVETGSTGSRPGWHTDGFGTNDINYLWADKDHTEICNQEFDLSKDHQISMQQMEDQVKPENIIQYNTHSVIRITPEHVHRTPPDMTPGYRAFARVSISSDKYDKVGNAHNHYLDYNWDMNPRTLVRNDTSTKI